MDYTLDRHPISKRRACGPMDLGRSSFYYRHRKDPQEALRSTPDAITLDNGTEFTSRVFDAWAFERRIALDFIRPGRPVENGTIESLNGKLRDECLSQHWFHSLDEAREILDAFKLDYNEIRPHSSLENQTPNEVAERLLAWAAG